MSYRAGSTVSAWWASLASRAARAGLGIAGAALLAGGLAGAALAQDTDRGVVLEQLSADQAVLTENKYAIVIGINDYASEDIPDLQYCVTDAQAVAQALMDTCGYPESHVVLLTDQDATRLNVLKALGRLADRQLYPAPDTLMVYFSGHGVNINDTDYFIPYDGTVDPDIAEDANISVERVVDKVDQSGFPRKMMFVDACRSALNTGAKGLSGFTQEIQLQARVANGLKVMFSAEAGRVSKENPNLGHGVFTYYLLEGLKGAAADRDGVITFGDLEKYIIGKMRDYSMQYVGKEQMPVTKGEGSAGMVIALVTPPEEDNAYLAEQLRFRGNEFYDQGKFNEAAAQYRAALVLDPEDSSACFNLGYALSRLGKDDEAVEAYLQYLQVDPGNTMAHNNLGVCYENLKRYDEALAEYQEALRLDPANAYPQRNTGDVYLALGRKEDARQAYAQAVQLDPTWAFPYYSIGQVYASDKDYKNAELWYRQALAVDPAFTDAFFGLGTAYLAQEKFREAEDAYNQCLQLIPDLPDCYNALGGAYYAEGRYEEALALYNEAIKRDAKWPYPYGGLGDTYYAMKRYDEAIAAYHEVIARDPKLAWAYNGAGNALLDSGRLEDAIPEYQKAIEADPKWSSPHNGLGVALFLLKRYAECEPELWKAVELDPLDPLPVNNLAELYYTQGNYPRARELAQQALDLAAPGSADYGTAEDWLRKCDEAEGK